MANEEPKGFVGSSGYVDASGVHTTYRCGDEDVMGEEPMTCSVEGCDEEAISQMASFSEGAFKTEPFYLCEKHFRQKPRPRPVFEEGDDGRQG